MIRLTHLLQRPFVLTSAPPGQWLRWSAPAAVTMIALLAVWLQSVYVPNDFDGYRELMLEVQGTGAQKRGKEFVALIFLRMEELAPYWWLGNLAFLTVAWFVFKRARHVEAFFIFALLSLPVMPYVGFVSKELLIAITCCAVLLAAVRARALAVVGFFLITGLFGLFVRPYYIPALGFAVAVALAPWPLMVILGGAAMLVLLMTPAITGMLIDTKVAMWERLYYQSKVNSLLDVREVDLYDFGLRASDNIDNLFTLTHLFLSNMLQLITVPIWLFGPRGLFFAVYMAVFCALFAHAWRHGERAISAFVAFVFAFLLFLVPDAGTLVRHMSALSLMLYVALVVRCSADKSPDRVPRRLPVGAASP